MSLALIAAALAAPGFYHPADVAASSERFAATSERMATRATEAQAQVRRHAAALRAYEVGLDLLGERVDPAERAHIARLEQQHNRQVAAAQAFADEVIGRFDDAFGAALQRALATRPGAQRCERTVAAGPRLPGGRGLQRPNPACQGPDLNAALAAALDADSALEAALGPLQDVTWPSLDLPREPRPAPAARWVAIEPVVRGVAAAALADIDRRDEAARQRFHVAIEQGATTAELQAMRDQAAAIDARTAQERAALASDALDRADVLFRKQGGDLGWCAQPPVLGGCEGEDATAAVAPALLADRKLVRALERP